MAGARAQIRQTALAKGRFRGPDPRVFFGSVPSVARAEAGAEPRPFSLLLYMVGAKAQILQSALERGRCRGRRRAQIFQAALGLAQFEGPDPSDCSMRKQMMGSYPVVGACSQILQPGVLFF